MGTREAQCLQRDDYQGFFDLVAGQIATAIALSAYAAEFDQQQVKEAGFQQHIAKPLNVDALVAIVSKLVDLKPIKSQT
ncbi:response regulator [Pleurocapsa sp. FMAR1]|uniref:hypothetical protein n=1 Tax=Pleurocapsa sp. FMAR1 TaxID=3040204 RepID=UPI0029C7EBF0|nr:hypothetical protein [Pleurocapsa sp. FMAR1]